MCKCCVITLPAMGKCCDSKGGEKEFTVKVKVKCSPDDEECRIEMSPEDCCAGDKPEGGSDKK